MNRIVVDTDVVSFLTHNAADYRGVEGLEIITEPDH